MTANLPAWLKFDWQSLFQPSVWGALFSTILQYVLLFLLLIFLFRLLRLMGELVRGSRLHVGISPEKEKSFSGGAQLRVVDDAQQLLRQTVFPVRASLSIGRGEHNDIIVNDPFVSYEHSSITRYPEGRYVLTDLGSTNQTRVNEQAAQGDVVLQTGDRIQIGSVVFQFER